ncbi:MAG: hypothetical protein KKA67_10590 [Spirochaetes bacterium]|nr:hypothetical protein [Spirochaetota bacterium]MBU1080068.1 hypothetical protein [Spirochaetota bacterium]
METKATAAIVMLAALCAGAFADDGLSGAARAWLSERSEISFAVTADDGETVELLRWMAAEYGFHARLSTLPPEAAREAVLGGAADAVAWLADDEPGAALLDLGASPFGTGRVAVAKGDALLLAVLDAGIMKASATGALASIHGKWTGRPLPGQPRAAAPSPGPIAFAALIPLSVAAAAGAWSLGRAAGQKASRRLVEGIAELRALNEALGSENARLRLDLEERSRLEEAKRRIDAAAAARRVEELTRCAIAAAIADATGAGAAGSDTAGADTLGAGADTLGARSDTAGADTLGAGAAEAEEPGEGEKA